MPFTVNKQDLKKSQKCPPGMHLFTLTEVEDEYFNEKGTKVQRVDFESDGGYIVPYWFNDKFSSNLLEFIQAADGITLDMNMEDLDIDLKDYKGKKVAGSVSHVKDKNNKIQAQIDNFFSPDKVPF